MGEFSYVDIFATKGLEYLLVIGFLVGFIVFWRILGRPARPAGAPERAPLPGWFEVPAGLHFHAGHSWARVGHEGVVTVGLDDFAQKLLGPPDGLELPAPGATLQQGAAGWAVKVGGAAIEMLSPVSGEVLEVNEAVTREPGLVASEPYGAGWLARIRVDRLGRELKNLLTGKLAARWNELVEQEIRGRMAEGLGVVLQDGGTIVPGIAKSLSPEGWEDLARELLRTRDR